MQLINFDWIQQPNYQNIQHTIKPIYCYDPNFGVTTKAKTWKGKQNKRMQGRESNTLTWIFILKIKIMYITS
jgi:hypothetical protein